MDPRCRAFTRHGKPFTPSGQRCRNLAHECRHHSEPERQAAYAYDERVRRGAQVRNFLVAAGGVALLLCCMIGVASKGLSAVKRSLSPGSLHLPATSARIPATSAWTAAPTSWRPEPTNATVTSTVTRTTAAPSRSDANQPHWEGTWLRNYSQGSNDCAQVDDYFVVQPHGEADTYMLRDGCFPHAVVDSVNSHCTKLFHGTIEGFCAIWDPDLTLSDPRRVGDIAVVALTQACLDRANLPSYSTQRPVHKDCVVLPR